jgi:hypothetical protein
MKRDKPHPGSTIQESPAINTRAEEKTVEERLAIGPAHCYETIRREVKRNSRWASPGCGRAPGRALAACIPDPADFQVRIQRWIFDRDPGVNLIGTLFSPYASR